MMRFYFVVILVLNIGGLLSAQISNFGVKSLEETLPKEYSEFFTTAELVHFDVKAFHHQLKSYDDGYTIGLDLGKGKKWDLELFPFDIYSENAKIRILHEDGDYHFPVPRDVSFRGHIKDNYGSVVLFIIHEDHLTASINDGTETIRIESANNFVKSASRDEYLIFKSSDLRQEKNTYECGLSYYPEFNRDIDDSKKGDSGKNKATEKSAGDCYQVEFGVASDYLMYQDQGSTIQGVIDHVLDVMAGVATNFELNGSTNFDDGIEYRIEEQVISTCDDCDPWTASTSASTLLNDFTAWAQFGGFNVNIDMASLWTNRNFDGSTVGIAWRGSDLICNDFGYNVLQDYTNNADNLRVMTAHELGHNWNAIHSSGCIMNSSVNSSTCWANPSQDSINDQLGNHNMSCLTLNCPSITCDSLVNVVVDNITSTGFDISYSSTAENSYRIRVRDEETGNIIHTQTTSLEDLTVTPAEWEECHIFEVIVQNNCGGGDYGPATSAIVTGPVSQGCADFSVDKNIDWGSGTFNFTDQSTGATSWSWDFGDGGSSSSQNPSHNYTAAGLYTVELSINSGANTATFEDLVHILPTESIPYTPQDGGDMDDDDFGTASLTTGETSLFEKGIPSNYFNNSTNCWVTDLDSDLPIEENESCIYSPEFDFSNASSATLLFDLGMEVLFCNAPFGVQVQYSTDGGSAWTRLGTDTDANWYNRGPSKACSLHSDVFSDLRGWTFTSQNNSYSYNVDFLTGNSSVIFRWLFSLDRENGWSSSGYARDGAMLDNVEVSGVVPVELLSFEGKALDHAIQLDWHTTNELNNDFFIIEKSGNGNDFYNMDRVEAEANSKSNNEYTSMDGNPLNGLNYYRLSQFDKNGHKTTYQIINILYERIEIVKVFPNPIVGKVLRIEYFKPSRSIEPLRIYDIKGMKILELEMELDDGMNELEINVNGLNPGMYMLVLNERTIKRFIIPE